MSLFLSKLGRFSARHRFVVLAGWAVLFAVLTGVLALAPAQDDAGSSSQAPSSTQASQTLDRVGELFPGTGGQSSGDSLELVFQAPAGSSVTDPAVSGAVQDVLAHAADLPGVQAVSDPLDPADPYVSPDQSLAVATLDYGTVDEDAAEADYQAALDLRDDVTGDLRVELGGNLLETTAPPAGPGEIVGVLVAFVVLLLTFGSLLAAGANLLLAFVGVGVGIVGVLAYGAINPIGDTSIILAAMLGLAVGIDYSLFILSRFRSELREGRSVLDGIARATGTAGTAVVFAGLTVIIAVAGLSVVGIDVITEMGLAAAFAVFVAVLAALTLLPVAMRTLGRRVLPRKERKLPEGTVISDGTPERTGFLAGWSTTVVKHPVLSLIGGIVVLGIVAVPALDLKTAYNVPGGDDPTSTERAAYSLILDEFGGTQSPLVVLAEGQDIDADLAAIEQELGDLDGVEQVVPGQVDATGDAALLTVIPEGSPIDDRTVDLVQTIRSDSSVAGVDLQVTGEAAIYIDQDAQLTTALIQYLVIIVLLSLVLLTIMFRSLLIPLVATVGYLLSVAASFGGSVAVFQWGWLDAIIPAPQGDPMLSLLPIILVGVLFGLAMDYQVFLVSRIQEAHSKGLSPKEAITSGFGRSAPVLIAAGTIMTVVFAGFASSPMAIAASIAFGLVVGVAADVFLVRLVLMPAALSLLGEAAWWMPRWLDTILPDIDIEGHALDAQEARTERTDTGSQRVLVDA